MRFLHFSIGCIMMAGLVSACASSKQGRTMKSTINGSWNLQTINTEGINAKFTAKVFNETDLNCFVGSSWDFISNNSTGTYTLVGGTTGCSTLQRNIRWSIFEPKDSPKEFQFKRLDEKRNPMDDNNGFRLSVTVLDNNTMQLKSAITFEGKPGNIVYNFVKK
ncbi:MAG: lipocalin family protein [Ferruginibacter sp.]|nr:lipocalin family protein [Ferruginibacter sp.]